MTCDGVWHKITFYNCIILSLFNSSSQFFRRVARMDTSLDITRALKVSIRGLPKDWRHPPGRPCHTWLRTLDADLQPHNFGLNSAWLGRALEAPHGKRYTPARGMHMMMMKLRLNFILIWICICVPWKNKILAITSSLANWVLLWITDICCKTMNMEHFNRR